MTNGFIEELDDEENLNDMSPLEGDEEVKEGKGLNILTPNKVLSRLTILLPQTKAGNNSWKLKKRNQANAICFVLE